MEAKRLTRRQVLRWSGLALATGAVAACQPQVVEKIVKETVVVTEEKVVEKVVKEAVEVEKEVTRVVEKAAEAKPREAIDLVMMYGAQEFPEAERELFEEKYAPYTLTFLETDMTKMMAMLAAGNQLDIWRNQGIACPSDVIKRLPLDLTDYFELSEVFKEDDILPVNDYYVVHGRRYGFVKDWSPDYSVFARKDYFEEAGVTPPEPGQMIDLQTWREWSEKLIVREGDRILRWGTGWAPLQAPVFYQTTTYEPMGSLFNEDGSKLMLRDDPKNYEAAKFMFDWKMEGTLPSAINPTIGDWSGPDFRDGVSASVNYGYWYSGFVMDGEWERNDNLVVLPAPVWGPNYANPCAAGTGGSVSSQTKYPDAAWTLFQYFFGEEPAVNRAEIGWGVPGLNSLLDIMPQEEPWRKQALDAVRWEMENSSVFKIDWPAYVTHTAYGSAYTKYEESALKGEMSFDEMLENIEMDVDELIEEGMDRAGVA